MPNQTAKLRILYVEDHEDTLELVTMVLNDRQYDVATTGSIEGAWQLICKDKFDLYLLDSWLLDGSGLDLCRRIREIDGHTPILFYSAAAYEVDRDSALNAGAQGYLVKPGKLSDLCAVVERLLELRRRKEI